MCIRDSGIPIQLNDYSGNIFVPLLMAAVLAVVYRGLKRVIPDSVQLVFVPFLSLVVVFALTILVIGPLGIWLGSGLGAATAWPVSYTHLACGETWSRQ